MGLRGGLVKVFCKSKSSTANCHQEINLGLDYKSRWTSVRLYLCGDELNSAVIENDSASIESSQAIVIQPIQEYSVDAESFQAEKVEEHEEFTVNVEENPPIKYSEEKEAAIHIQSAFRGFMARKWYDDIRRSNEGDDKGVEDPTGVDEAASIEGLADDSTENFSLGNENGMIQHKGLRKSRSQLYKQKEEWDDSTLSGDTLRLRIQNKLDAATRRRRALAYAFSQQLRTCTAKKKPNRSDSATDPSGGWSWLESWMATQVPDNSFTNDRRLPMIWKNRFDISIEAKESCGSNGVPVDFDRDTPSSETPRDEYHNSVKNKSKAPRSMSLGKMMPECHRPSGSTKARKRSHFERARGEKRENQVQSR